MHCVVLSAMAAAVGRAGRVVVVGGGASGYFAAITAARAAPRPSWSRRRGNRSWYRERRRPLQRDPRPDDGRPDVVERYPRGRRGSGGCSSLFGPDDMRRWFEAEGVELKTEADGRVFPVTDDSQTIADALRNAAHKAGVLFKGGAAATTIDVAGDGFAVKTGDDAYDAAAVVLATGSAPGGYALAKALGHEPVKPCPSLFSFRVKSPVLEGLAGLSVPDARVELKGAKKKPPPPTRGPLLVTHRGLSGPAALRLSAFKARELQDCGYKASPWRIYYGRVAGRRALDARRAQEEACGRDRRRRDAALRTTPEAALGAARGPRERPRRLPLGRRVRTCVEINQRPSLTSTPSSRRYGGAPGI